MYHYRVIKIKTLKSQPCEIFWNIFYLSRGSAYKPIIIEKFSYENICRKQLVLNKYKILSLYLLNNEDVRTLILDKRKDWTAK